jgi:hypothetical protein
MGKPQKKSDGHSVAAAVAPQERSVMLNLFESARRASVPVLVIRTADQFATVEAIRAHSVDFPVVTWDAATGITAVPNSKGEQALASANPAIEPMPTIPFAEAMVAAQRLPDTTILCAYNAGRQLHSQEPGAVAANVQAIANLRDQFKLNFRMLVLLGASISVPAELQHDVIVIDDQLPTRDQLAVIVRELYDAAASAKKGAPFPSLTPDLLSRAVDAITGLSAFEAEQVTSMSFLETGLDIDAMWERTRVAIEQTPGLSVYRGKDRFDGIRGCASVKARLADHVGAKTPVGVVVWIDEGSDVFQNVEQDTSGVKTDQQRQLLVEMEANGWRGMIFVGVPGCAKSALARTFGNEAGVPTISVDFGGMENKYVGESEANLRQSLDVIKRVGGGHAFFILTCNSLKGIRPQFQRRFKRGIFFFDLPTKDEREAIWSLYLAKFALDPKQPRPDDEAWTGAEIRECCESAWDTGKSLLESAKFIVPVARSRAADIEAMRKEAHARFLDAGRDGAYQYKSAPMQKQVRAIALPNSGGKETVN